MQHHYLDLYRAEQEAQYNAALYHPALQTLLDMRNGMFSAETADGRYYSERLEQVSPETVRAAVTRAAASLLKGK